jgi:hypothetical protein
MQDIWTLPIVWHSVGPAFYWRRGWSLMCSRMMLSMSLLVFFSLFPGSKSADFEAFDSNCLHWLYHYVVWSPVVRVPHCISGAVWTHAPSLTLSLSCTAMSPIAGSFSVNSTVMHRCLPVCLLSLTCSCTIYTATSVLQTVSVVHASYFINISQYQM